MYYSGIDLHKYFSVITTVDEDGSIIKQAQLKNNNFEIINYFKQLKQANKATVETTGGWYWISDLLHEHHIELVLAHAKYLKAISYAKVKTDKVDSHILAQLLRLNFIPVAHKIANDKRDLRDLMRTRLRLTQKHTSCLNNIHRILEKFNIKDPKLLNELYLFQYQQYLQQAKLIKEQINSLEKKLHPLLIPNEDIQRLLWIPGIGKINAFTLYLEINDINRFPSERQFFSYCRLVPDARNSGGKVRQKSASKDGNKYLKSVFTDAAVHAIQYYPVIRKFYHNKLRKKNKQVARAIISKEIARIVYYVLKNKIRFNGRFKGLDLQHVKSQQWPRLTSPDA